MRQCNRCQQDTYHFYLCDDCIEIVSKQMVASGRADNILSAVELLYEDEVEVYHSAWKPQKY